MRKRLFISLGLAAGLTLLPTAALAHHAEIEGYQDCDGVVTFLANPWEGDPNAESEEDILASLTNPSIEVRLEETDGTVIKTFTGAFDEDTNYQFNGEHDIGERRDVKLVAEAKAPWANGAVSTPEDVREDLVAAPVNCPEPTTTTAASTTTAPDESTTTAPGESTTTVPGETTTTVPGETPAPTSGDTDEVKATPVAVEASGNPLPLTGSTVIPAAIGAAALLAAGTAAVFFARRRRAAGAEEAQS